MNVPEAWVLCRQSERDVPGNFFLFGNEGLSKICSDFV